MRDAVERLYRRVQLMVGIGRTTAPADDSGRVQTVQVRLSPDEVRDGTQVAGQFGFSSHAPVGSDVVTVFMGGDRSKGIVIATLNGDSRFRGLKPGETAMSNAVGMSIHLSAGGIQAECGGKPVVVRGTPRVTVTADAQITLDVPDVFTTGNLHAGTGASGTFTTPTGQVVTVRDGIIVNIF